MLQVSNMLSNSVMDCDRPSALPNLAEGADHLTSETRRRLGDRAEIALHSLKRSRKQRAADLAVDIAAICRGNSDLSPIISRTCEILVAEETSRPTVAEYVAREIEALQMVQHSPEAVAEVMARPYEFTPRAWAETLCRAHRMHRFQSRRLHGMVENTRHSAMAAE